MLSCVLKPCSLLDKSLLRNCRKQTNIERRQAVHEKRLASVKASLALSTPLRFEFMDKRLSKNFHSRRQHETVVAENLKLLRALEGIHARSGGMFGSGSDAAFTGMENIPASSLAPVGGGDGDSAAAAANPKESRTLESSASVPAACDVVRNRKSQQHSRMDRLSMLLERERNVRATIVARENEKMMEVSVLHAETNVALGIGKDICWRADTTV